MSSCLGGRFSGRLFKEHRALTLRKPGLQKATSPIFLKVGLVLMNGPVIMKAFARTRLRQRLDLLDVDDEHVLVARTARGE